MYNDLYYLVKATQQQQLQCAWQYCATAYTCMYMYMPILCYALTQGLAHFKIACPIIEPFNNAILEFQVSIMSWTYTCTLYMYTCRRRNYLRHRLKNLRIGKELNKKKWRLAVNFNTYMYIVATLMWFT